MFQLEYAQNYNGRFHGWVVGGHFATREAAEAEAKSRNLRRSDYLISECGEEEW